MNVYTTISARSLQKTYKAIIEEVKTTQKPVVLTTQQKPQVAIVSLEDLEELNKTKAIKANLKLLQHAVDSKEELKNLPSNLREVADDMIYSTHE